MIKTRQILTALLFVFGLATSTFASENLSLKQLLNSMTKAQKQLNYQISFVQTNLASLQSFRYKHIQLENKQYAQLMTLDGTTQEIILRDDLVSYFRPSFPAFTIKSQYIVDYLPSIINANIDKLTENYDFSSLGRNRIADRLVQVIKLMPKDNFRYQYILFIDEQSHLLLRSDMLDHNNNLLESFYVVNLDFEQQVNDMLQKFKEQSFPPLLNENKESKNIKNWQLGWLPKGFTLINENINFEDEDNKHSIESRLYSDGLFSFTIYVADKILNENQENLWLQGTNTIYSSNIGDKEVTIIGQIPTSTAKRIAQDLKFK